MKSTIHFKHDIIDLMQKQQLKRLLETSDLVEEFSCDVRLREAYPDLTTRAICALIPFVTSYLFESGFSTMVVIKTKARNLLTFEETFERFSLSVIETRFKKLTSENQQFSH